MEGWIRPQGEDGVVQTYSKKIIEYTSFKPPRQKFSRIFATPPKEGDSPIVAKFNTLVAWIFEFEYL